MIYTNLLIFLTAIFLFSIDSVPSEPTYSLFESLLVLVLLIGLFGYGSHRVFSRASARTSGGYFAAEKRLSLSSLLFFAIALYATDLKYYLSWFSAGDRLSAGTNSAGLAVFMTFLSIMWLAGRKNYGAVFGRHYSRTAFVWLNVRSNLPIVIPWAALSLVYDLVSLLPFQGVQSLFESSWGDIVFLGFFLVFVMLFFPPLVRRLWGCRRLPEGPLKQHLVQFCARQNFNAELYLWPLFEGRVLTAGVMGMIPGIRYILLTPAIIETMSIGELEAVMAHEIGHVKKKHLFLYVVLIGGFSVLAGVLAEPLLYHLFSYDWVFSLTTNERVSPETLMGLVGGVPLLFFMLLYFRFIFGYFIRNFERQADAYVFKVFDSSRLLISAFDKIAGVGGQERNKPSWHHFSIAERVEYLERCERDRSWIFRQDRKVFLSLAVFLVLLGAAVGLGSKIPTDQMALEYDKKYFELFLMDKDDAVGDKALWYRAIGDLMINRNMEQRALVAYDKAMEFSVGRESPSLLNNLAWLLLTSRESRMRDPERALVLAKAAAKMQPEAHILDTLATAYWANGYIESAVATELKALEKATSREAFYRVQIERFRSEIYTTDTQFPE